MGHNGKDSRKKCRLDKKPSRPDISINSLKGLGEVWHLDRNNLNEKGICWLASKPNVFAESGANLSQFCQALPACLILRIARLPLSNLSTHNMMLKNGPMFSTVVLAHIHRGMQSCAQGPRQILHLPLKADHGLKPMT